MLVSRRIFRSCASLFYVALQRHACLQEKSTKKVQALWANSKERVARPAERAGRSVRAPVNASISPRSVKVRAASADFRGPVTGWASTSSSARAMMRSRRMNGVSRRSAKVRRIDEGVTQKNRPHTPRFYPIARIVDDDDFPRVLRCAATL